MIRNRKYKESYQIAKKIETLGLETSEILCIKTKILLEQGQVINALNIVQKIFDDYAEDPFIVGTSIVLAINNKREVHQ